MRQIAIIGAGFIASAHVKALSGLRNVSISAVVDPDEGRASALARVAGDARVFTSIDDLLREARPQAAHVLTPPPLHLATAEPLLRAGVATLLEKPMAETAEDAARLNTAAREGGARLVVNHNFAHHPAFVRAQRLLAAGRIGRLRRVQMLFAAPLRQMAARQFGHWMFNNPRNLLLEQAVHPLSQLDALLGGIDGITAGPGAVRRPAGGIVLVTDWRIEASGPLGAGGLDIVLGADFPRWTLTLLGTDGAIEVDIFEGRVSLSRPHNHIPPFDYAWRNLARAGDAAAASLMGALRFVAENSRLGPSSDGFSRSMAASIRAFHESRDTTYTDESAARLVRLCSDIARAAPEGLPAADAPARTPGTPDPQARYDVALIGGTGFIGQHLTAALVAQGKRVAVIARTVSNLPSLYDDPLVDVYRGSISRAEALAPVLGRCRQVVNLAHGGGGATREDVARAMVDGAVGVARAAAVAAAERLIYVSSSAALYLGDPNETITMSTPPDPFPDERGDYARAKVLSEIAMLAEPAPPLVILRPAVVVGEGGSPFHSALGAYENDTHCAGWNGGDNPLPFVLAEDVASAIIAALDAPLKDVAGKSFNIAGDVRWTARRYTEELARATGRPLKFHASRHALLMGLEWTRYAVKRIAGRRDAPKPSARDLKSRGMVAQIDTSQEKAILGWRPCAEEAIFRARAITVHAPGKTVTLRTRPGDVERDGDDEAAASPDAAGRSSVMRAAPRSIG